MGKKKDAKERRARLAAFQAEFPNTWAKMLERVRDGSLTYTTDLQERDDKLAKARENAVREIVENWDNPEYRTAHAEEMQKQYDLLAQYGGARFFEDPSMPEGKFRIELLPPAVSEYRQFDFTVDEVGSKPTMEETGEVLRRVWKQVGTSMFTGREEVAADELEPEVAEPVKPLSAELQADLDALGDAAVGAPIFESSRFLDAVSAMMPTETMEEMHLRYARERLEASYANRDSIEVRPRSVWLLTDKGHEEYVRAELVFFSKAEVAAFLLERESETGSMEITVRRVEVG